MAFWIAATAMSLAVVGLLVGAMLRGRRDAVGATDLDVYRDQLAEVERDNARGVLDPTEAERLRIEVSRRLLDADRQARSERSTDGPGGATRMAALAAGVTVLGGGFGTYLALGAPGYPDLPIADRIAMAEEARRDRPGQEAAESATPQDVVEANPRHTELMERLRATLAERPDDIEGYTLLARNEAGIGNFIAAREAQARVVDLKGDDATARDWADYLLLLVYAAGGYVSPEAERATAEILRRDPSEPTARYVTGLLHAQTGRPDLAFRVWRPLVEEGVEGAPWAAPLDTQIREAARQAGVDYQPPAAAAPAAPEPGPGRAEMEAAAEMSPEERQQMVRGMVEGLAGRLADEGGPAEDWARLINALGVLGEFDRAGEIYAEAREAFGTNAADLAVIEAAAERAGLAQ